MAEDIGHIITKKEITQVRMLGFEITSGTKSPEDFLNEYFRGLELLRFLQNIDQLLSPLVNTSIIKEFAYFESKPQMIMIQYYSEDHENEDIGVALSRTFIKNENELILEHDFFRLPLKSRKSGIGKQILSYSLQQCLLMHVDKIKVRAALENGGYVWAKAFFAATESIEVKKILDRAKRELKPGLFKAVKRIYDNYYLKNPNGRDFPMVKWSELPGMDVILSKSNWHGEIDLNNLELLTKFKNYVA